MRLLPAIASWTVFGSNSANENGRSGCINTWQSWLFIPNNLCPCSTHLDRFDTYPSENFTSEVTHLNNAAFDYADNLKMGTRTFPSSLICTSLLEHNAGKSNLEFLLSFVFPGTFNNVLMMLSKKFFSICNTSRLCRRSRSFQYGSSQNILFFVPIMMCHVTIIHICSSMPITSFPDCFRCTIVINIFLDFIFR